MIILKNMFCSIIVLLFLFSCSSAEERDSKKETVKPDTLEMQKDSIKVIYIDDLDFNTVAKSLYRDTFLYVVKRDNYDGTFRYDTTINGKISTPGYEEGSEWFEEFTKMTPLISVVYKEDSLDKAAFLFIGDYTYQHGHTWSMVEVYFFEKENEKWRFTDSLSFDDFDIDNVEQVNLSKNGFVIRSIGVWANMGADSERQNFWFFENGELKMNFAFWTGSGSMFGSESGEEYTSQSAEIVFGEDSAKEYRDIYYYGERYDCTQKEIEDDLSFCSCKFVWEKDEYKVYPLTEKERRNKKQ